MNNDETSACTPRPLTPSMFNPNCILPYALKPEHVETAMQDFLNYLGVINHQANSKQMLRLESLLMPANFSSIVGEFMTTMIPNYCPNLVKNQYPNGHPDLIPINMFENNAVQYSTKGVEIKASHHSSGWQGHNAESVWLMVFVFDSNSANDKARMIPPKPFAFKSVYAAKLAKDDWSFSGRSETSRRTITARVNRNGIQRMKENWVYKDL